MTPGDNELVKGIIDGKQSAFQILYLKYSDLLFAYILHHLDHDREVASDIWQDTWVVFIEKVNDFNIYVGFDKINFRPEPGFNSCFKYYFNNFKKKNI